MQCKTAFVTGGGSGIGLALAEALAKRGARIAAFDLRFSDEARARLRKVCPDALFLEVDVRDAAGVEAAVNKAVAQIGAPDVAINSAGVQVARPFLEISSERFDFVVDINLKGSRNFAAAVLRHMRSGGHLALVASIAGVVSNYGYCGLQFVQVRRRRARLGAAHRMQDAGHLGFRHLPARSRDADGGGGAPDGARHHDADQAVRRDGLRWTISARRSCTASSGAEFMIVPGSWRARFTVFLGRTFPRLMARITDNMIAKA